MQRAITQAKKESFLEVFRTTGIISTGARAAGVHRRTVYAWRENDPEFEEQFKEAEQDAADALEAEALRRATGDKASDTMLIVLLKMRGRFNERYEHTGKGGGKIQHEQTLRLEFDEPLPTTTQRRLEASPNGDPAT